MIKILIVDDEPDIESLFKQKFRKKIQNREWSFVFCHNGEEALEALQKHEDMDLVLSDINMPKMDGLSLLEKIKSNRFDVKTIIISAYGDMGNIRTAMNRGAFDFITKPIDFEDVEQTLNKTIQHVQTLRQALENQNKWLSIQKELEVAKKIQKSILPTSASPTPKCDIFSHNAPAKEVGGDYYDLFLIDKEHLALVIADVSGKGISSALFAVVNQTLMKSTAGQFLSPKKCIESVNLNCSKNNSNCMFATVFYAILNLKQGSLNYCNAGHLSPFKIQKGGPLEALPPTGDIPVGAKENFEFHEKKSYLKPGERLFLYTDGLTEAHNTKKEEFGEKRLTETLSQSQTLPVLKAGESILKSVKDFSKEAEPYDDITFVLAEYKG